MAAPVRRSSRSKRRSLSKTSWTASKCKLLKLKIHDMFVLMFNRRYADQNKNEKNIEPDSDKMFSDPFSAALTIKNRGTRKYDDEAFKRDLEMTAAAQAGKLADGRTHIDEFDVK